MELLKAVKAHILEEPKRAHMGMWISRNETGDDAPPCGTIGCIAGWAVELGSQRKIDVYSIKDKARRLLELDFHKYGTLFYTNNWPRNFAVALDAQVPGSKKYAAIIGKRIDQFIKKEYPNDRKGTKS